MDTRPEDFTVRNLGIPTFVSPLNLSVVDGDMLTNYIKDDERVLYDALWGKLKDHIGGESRPAMFEKAGPREKIFFDHRDCRVGIVTCGGLCPGINDVIRALVMHLTWWYKVKTVYGFKYGYQGLVKDHGLQPVVLYPEVVADIHSLGGSILGSSRGPQDVEKMVDRLMDYSIQILFCIGGDGTLRGARGIADEIIKRGLKISVIGVPKTIDNDIGFIEKTFGFETAFTHAVEALRVAHVEAKGAINGVGLVKLMGRESGFIAANASLASGDVNFCLIPEMKFDLEGENGFFQHLQQRLAARQHAVVVVGEGVAAHFCSEEELDASGNKKHGDVGAFLRDKITRHFTQKGFPVTVRYIDPSYMIRSAQTIPSDSIYCTQLAQSAAHAGMAGKTGMVVGIWNNQFTHVPIEIAVKNRKFIDPESMFWLNVIESTGQPRSMLNT